MLLSTDEPQVIDCNCIAKLNQFGIEPEEGLQTNWFA
jgi:hypothetical protein